MKFKRGQETMGMPFGIIFAIMLIVFFIVIAFIAIKYFLSLGDCGQVAGFYEDLQKKVNDAYSSEGYSDSFKISLPSGIEKVCFADLKARQKGSFSAEFQALQSYDDDEANVFLVPVKKACQMPSGVIKNIELTKIIALSNPYCVVAPKGKLQVQFEIGNKGVLLK